MSNSSEFHGFHANMKSSFSQPSQASSSGFFGGGAPQSQSQSLLDNSFSAFPTPSIPKRSLSSGPPAFWRNGPHIPLSSQISNVLESIPSIVGLQIQETMNNLRLMISEASKSGAEYSKETVERMTAKMEFVQSKVTECRDKVVECPNEIQRHLDGFEENQRKFREKFESTLSEMLDEHRKIVETLNEIKENGDSIIKAFEELKTYLCLLISEASKSGIEKCEDNLKKITSAMELIESNVLKECRWTEIRNYLEKERDNNNNIIESNLTEILGQQREINAKILENSNRTKENLDSILKSLTDVLDEWKEVQTVRRRRIINLKNTSWSSKWSTPIKKTKIKSFLDS